MKLAEEGGKMKALAIINHERFCGICKNCEIRQLENGSCAQCSFHLHAVLNLVETKKVLKNLSLSFKKD